MNKKSPEFHSKYKSCETELSLRFAKIDIILHQEALQELLKIFSDLQAQIEDVKGVSSVTTIQSNRLKRTLSNFSESITYSKKEEIKRKYLRLFQYNVKIIDVIYLICF